MSGYVEVRVFCRCKMSLNAQDDRHTLIKLSFRRLLADIFFTSFKAQDVSNSAKSSWVKVNSGYTVVFWWCQFQGWLNEEDKACQLSYDKALLNRNYRLR